MIKRNTLQTGYGIVYSMNQKINNKSLVILTFKLKVRLNLLQYKSIDFNLVSCKHNLKLMFIHHYYYQRFDQQKYKNKIN